MTTEPAKTPNLIEQMMRAFVAAKLGTMHHDHKARTTATSNFLEELEVEFAPMIAPLVNQMIDKLPDDHPMQPLLKEMVEPTHQLSFLLQVIFVIPAVLGTLREATQIFAQPYVNELWSREPNVPIPPADLADMVERTIVGRDDAASMARESGIEPQNFDLLVLNTGEPYGPMDALRLWRQGRIDEAQLEHVIHYSRIRNEFIPNLKLLAHDFMSPADAVELTLKKVLSHEAGVTSFEQGGGYGPQFDVLLEGAGNPIGPEQAIALWNHGLIDEAEVDRVIAHGRTNPSFGEDVKLTRHKFLSVFQIHQALVAGAVGVDKAIEWMLADGFNAEQAAAFAHAGKVAKATAPKHPTEAMIVELYEAKELDREQATAALVNLGYIAAEVPELLALYDARRSLALKNKAVGKVQAAFLAKRITVDRAKVDLTELEVPAEAVDHYVTTWAIERETQIRLLTPAQIGSLFKHGYIADSVAIARWEAMGYASDDAYLLLAEYGGPPPEGSPAAIYAAANPAPPSP